MLTVLEVTLPVFALVFCGWLAARRRLMSPEAVAGINAFVFLFALPAMLFRAVASQPVARIVPLTSTTSPTSTQTCFRSSHSPLSAS